MALCTRTRTATASKGVCKGMAIQAASLGTTIATPPDEMVAFRRSFRKTVKFRRKLVCVAFKCVSCKHRAAGLCSCRRYSTSSRLVSSPLQFHWRNVAPMCWRFLLRGCYLFFTFMAGLGSLPLHVVCVRRMRGGLGTFIHRFWVLWRDLPRWYGKALATRSQPSTTSTSSQRGGGGARQGGARNLLFLPFGCWSGTGTMPLLG